MKKLKERIPTEEALEREISTLVPKMTEDIRASVGHIEAEYLRFKRRIGFGGIFLVFFFITLHILLSILNIFLPTFFVFLIGGMLLFLAILKAPDLYQLLKTHATVYDHFNNGVNKVVFETVLPLFGLSRIIFKGASGADTLIAAQTSVKSLLASFIPSLREQTKGLSFLAESELITEAHNVNTVGDIITATCGDSLMSIVELDIKHRPVVHGKNEPPLKIFKGYLVIYDLDRALLGKTFISTEGDTNGWGHKSFWNSFKDSDLKETQLEWNKFENLLHVATTDGAEARYILTTDFMHDLYLWWERKEGNIRLSFIGKRMYILFPDEQVVLDGTIAGIKEEEVSRYSFAISRSLLHVMHLIEDVRL